MVNRMRHNRSQRGSTRSHHFLKSENLSKCPDCGQMRLNHRMCANCGKYNNKEVVSFAVKEKKVVKAVKALKTKKEDKKVKVKKESKKA